MCKRPNCGICSSCVTNAGKKNHLHSCLNKGCERLDRQKAFLAKEKRKNLSRRQHEGNGAPVTVAEDGLPISFTGDMLYVLSELKTLESKRIRWATMFHKSLKEGRKKSSEDNRIIRRLRDQAEHQMVSLVNDFRKELSTPSPRAARLIDSFLAGERKYVSSSEDEEDESNGTPLKDVAM